MYTRHVRCSIRFVVFILLAASTATAQAAMPDRSELARQTEFDPQTGDPTRVPENFVDVGAPDRSNFATSTSFDKDGNPVDVPQAYMDVGARDRNAFAVATRFDDQGNPTAVPDNYADVGAPRRDPFAVETSFDKDGNPQQVPSRYFALHAPNLVAFSQLFMFNPDTGDPTETARDALHLAPGEAPRLEIRRSPGGLMLSWLSSCAGGAVNHGLYQGTIGRWYSHTRLDCSDEGSDMIEEVPLPAESAYFLVVPLSRSDEGSYSPRSNGTERPRGVQACAPSQLLATCP